MPRVKSLMLIPILLSAPTAYGDSGMSGSPVMKGIKSLKLSTTLEPYIGYQGLGVITEKQINSPYTSVNGGYYGMIFGGRALLEVNRSLFTGLDFTYAPSMGYSTSLGKAPVNNYSNEMRLGALLGFNISSVVPSLPVRVWVGYSFLQNLNDTNNSTNTIASSLSLLAMRGNSVKVGLSYLPYKYVSINLEYIWAFYSSLSSDTLTPGNSKNYTLPSTDYFGIQSITNQNLALSVSAPFNIAF